LKGFLSFFFFFGNRVSLYNPGNHCVAEAHLELMIILPYLLGTVTTGMYHHTQLMPVISTVEAEAGGLQISGQSELCNENLSQTIKKRWLGGGKSYKRIKLCTFPISLTFIHIQIFFPKISIE
jgi:hypothetical protein